MLRKLIEKVMFFIISPLFLLFFGYPPPPPTFKIDLCTTNLSNKFLSQENLWLWTFYNRQFANVNKKIWCMCNDSNKSLPLSCQLFVYTKITQLITQIFCLLWNLHCQKNLRKEYESKKQLSTVWKPTLTCYEEKIHSDCLTTILYYQKPLMQQCKQTAICLHSKNDVIRKMLQKNNATLL